eukprot:364369-Chlamydomonas_euryale.AAC.3
MVQKLEAHMSYRPGENATNFVGPGLNPHWFRSLKPACVSPLAKAQPTFSALGQLQPACVALGQKVDHLLGFGHAAKHLRILAAEVMEKADAAEEAEANLHVAPTDAPICTRKGPGSTKGGKGGNRLSGGGADGGAAAATPGGEAASAWPRPPPSPSHLPSRSSSPSSPSPSHLPSRSSSPSSPSPSSSLSSRGKRGGAGAAVRRRGSDGGGGGAAALPARAKRRKGAPTCPASAAKGVSASARMTSTPAASTPASSCQASGSAGRKAPVQPFVWDPDTQTYRRKRGRPAANQLLLVHLYQCGEGKCRVGEAARGRTGSGRRQGDGQGRGGGKGTDRVGEAARGRTGSGRREGDGQGRGGGKGTDRVRQAGGAWPSMRQAVPDTASVLVQKV